MQIVMQPMQIFCMHKSSSDFPDCERLKINSKVCHNPLSCVSDMGHCNGLKETYERLTMVTLLFPWEKFEQDSIKGDVYDDA